MCLPKTYDEPIFPILVKASLLFLFLCRFSDTFSPVVIALQILSFRFRIISLLFLHLPPLIFELSILPVIRCSTLRALLPVIHDPFFLYFLGFFALLFISAFSLFSCFFLNLYFVSRNFGRVTSVKTSNCII